MRLLFFYNIYIIFRKNWNLYRIIQMFLGIVFLINAISQNDMAIGVIGLLFVVLSITKTGCAGINCTIPPE